MIDQTPKGTKRPAAACQEADRATNKETAERQRGRMISTAELYQMRANGLKMSQIEASTGLTEGQIRGRLQRYNPMIDKDKPAVQRKPRLQASPMPRYDKPLTIEGDALVLDDLEVPFHHAEFVNRCLDLADAWKIENLALGGDVFHLDKFSAWGAAWQDAKPVVDTISEATETEWRARIAKLPPEYQAEWLEDLARLAENRDSVDDEIKVGAKTVKVFEQIFKQISYILGNHDDRFLRRLNSPITPQKLLDYLGLTKPCWNIAPYFYGVVTSGGERWRIEHQKSAAPNAAVKLADKNECHTVVAHNHTQSLQWSTSGKYYAISSGHTVDEERLAYSAQRSNQRQAHALGAVIIRDGFPYLLHPRVDWKRLMTMA